MPRVKRNDEPGAWFHVMNRGLARRTVFPEEWACRLFLAQLAREYRAQRIQLHAYCLLPTHFHLLVRSPQGSLSEALRRVQNTFVRKFNRRARRDGPLFRGRFLSKRIESYDYRVAVVRYIDANAVAARIVSRAERYPFGSAAALSAGSPPRWLTTSWIGRCLREAGLQKGSARGYFEAFPRQEEPNELEWVERRLLRFDATSDPLLDLVGSSPKQVRAWMERKAQLADGTSAGLPCASANRIISTLADIHASAPALGLHEMAEATLRSTLEVGLLREVGGLTWSEICQRTNLSSASARRRFFKHVQLLGHPAYQARLADLLAVLVGPASAEKQRAFR